MKNVLVLGAGKSSGVLINQLLKDGFIVTVADTNLSTAQNAIAGYANGIAVSVDSNDLSSVIPFIERNDVVVSMLPAVLHPQVAKWCLEAKKHLITPSYISNAMMQLDEEVKKNGLLFLNEMGLDPGIDHISACAMIAEIEHEGGRITSFKSHCGGLVSKESDNNPWHYKFSWNPRNVVLAGQGEMPIQWLESGLNKSLSYKQLFANATEVATATGEVFESYPNRDSLSYIDVYGLHGVETFYRGTLRQQGFCGAWQLLVQAGLCDDNRTIELADGATYNDLLGVLAGTPIADKVALADYLHTDIHNTALDKLLWLGLVDNVAIGINKGTVAQLLQKLLEEKWRLEPGDTDRVVMLHEIEYEKGGKRYKQIASLDRSGTQGHTAMAETVGLPIAIAIKLFAEGQIQQQGVLRPVVKNIYEPVLHRLEQAGIAFTHKTILIE